MTDLEHPAYRPNWFTVTCPDGTTHPEQFPSRDAAEAWAEWGHACLAAARHTITETPRQAPARLTLADGSTIPNEEGATAWNYYDGAPAVIIRPAGPNDAEPDSSGRLPHGVAWWCRTTSGTLDGSRMVSMATARRRGWTEQPEGATT